MAKESILIVEDEVGLALTIEDALLQASNNEMKVVICNTPQEALTVLKSNRFNLLISDLRLPGMSGLELIALVRKRYPQMRTILMTGYGTEEVERTAHKLTDAYLVKPFSLPAILRIIQNVIGGDELSMKSQVFIVDNTMNEIRTRLDALVFEVKAPYALVLDFSGHTMVDSGNPGVVDKAALNALLVSGMAASNELAKSFHENRAFDMHYCDGERYEIYLRKIDELMVLGLIIDLQATSERLGGIRLHLKRAVDAIRTLSIKVKEQMAGQAAPTIELLEVDNALDDMFGAEPPAPPDPAPAASSPAPKPAANPAPRPAEQPKADSELISLEDAVRMGIINPTNLPDKGKR